MNLIRYQSPQLSSWPPFNRLASLQDEVNRLFDFAWPSADSSLSSDWAPALDVAEDKDRFLVELEVPGIKKEDIKLSILDHVLTVSGERKDERVQREGATFRSERSFGQFKRSVTLSSAVDADKVKASYKDGILSIELPKAEEAKPKQIDVSVS